MFGVVPKKIWGKLMAADDDNLIPMVTNLFVVDTGSKKILCDTGLGSVLSEKEKKVYAVTEPSQIDTGLAGIGCSVHDIDYVIFSHLHTDHSGGAVTMRGGKMVPRFPKAKYVVQKLEWDDAMHPDERTSAVYIAERLKVIETSGQLQLVDGTVELLPGVKLVLTGGHTPGHQGMEFSSGGKTVVYYADIIPSSHHFKVPYVASVDLFPLDTMKVKRSLVKRALAGEIIVAFDHDIDVPIGRAVEDGVRTIITPVA